MLRWLLIGGFGFIGTIVRYAVQGGVQRLPLLDEMVVDGMVTLEKVQVVTYRASPRPETP